MLCLNKKQVAYTVYDFDLRWPQCGEWRWVIKSSVSFALLVSDDGGLEAVGAVQVVLM